MPHKVSSRTIVLCYRRVAALAAVPLAMACSDDPPAGASQDSITSIGGTIPSGPGSSATGSASAPECQSASDCDSEQMCHPTAGVCVEEGGSCSSNDDCDTSTYCDSGSETCLPGLTGSPCTSDATCAEGECTGGVCGCSGFAQSAEGISGPLDIYMIFDRTASMGDDCDYDPGGSPPVNSKACFATFALPDYLTNAPSVDTRLAFQFMSLPDEGCDGSTYSTPMVAFTQLPVPTDHQIVTSISAETFEGGYGTEIEGALRGITQFTADNVTPGREMIGVLMTDGDPNGCNGDIGDLADILADHLAETGIRTFVIGMDGATESNLERLGEAGGADPHDDFCGNVDAPCHYWNVGDGSGDAIASALRAISGQAAGLPCEYSVANIEPSNGMTIDYGKINVTLTSSGEPTTFAQVPGEGECPDDQPAWYYDDPESPQSIHLCQRACELASETSSGGRVTIVGGCQATVMLR